MAAHAKAKMAPRGQKRKAPEALEREGKEEVLRLYDWGDWCGVMEDLFSGDAERTQAGVEAVGRWRAAVGVNVSIEATANLLEAKARDFERERAICQGTQSRVTGKDVAAAYSMAVIRLVNGVTGELEQRNYGKKRPSVRSMAGRVDLPRELVDIRHAATHQALPSLPELRLGGSLALTYLLDNYWIPQREHLLRFERAAMRPDVLSPGAAALLTEKAVHPFLSNRPTSLPIQQAMSSQQLLTKLEVECPDGIETKLTGIEKALGITAELTHLWPASSVPLAVLLSRKQGICHLDASKVDFV